MEEKMERKNNKKWNKMKWKKRYDVKHNLND